jgi:hypothetical protein
MISDADISNHLGSERAFWVNVQDPAKRVRDPALLAELADAAYTRFESPYVRAASSVVLAYRACESNVAASVSPEAILERLQLSSQLLHPENSFTDGRWFLSASLAECALSMALGDAARAAEALKRAAPIFDVAYGHGQLFTNIVKTTFLRCALAAASDYRWDTTENLVPLVEKVLDKSTHLPVHYKFANEFAYEEVAYVYSMMRQIYKWRQLMAGDLQAADLATLHRAGFAWQVVGGPFKALLEKCAAATPTAFR